MTPFDVGELASRIGLPDEAAADEARARQGRLTKPAGSLGQLEDLTSGCAPPRASARRARWRACASSSSPATTASPARRGTSAYPPEVTAQMVLNLVAGGAGVSVLARTNGAGVRVLDLAVDVDYADLGAVVPDDVVHAKVRRGSGSIDVEDALTREQAEAALAAGARIADEEVDAGADLLVPGDMGIGNTTPAAALIGLLTGHDPASVVGRGTGIDSATWMRKTAAVRDAMRRGRAVMGDPVAVLATVGGADIAAMTGFLLGAAARRTPVLLDGVVSGAAALLAQRMAYRAPRWFLAGHRSTEPAHTYALTRMDLDPLLDLGLRLGEGRSVRWWPCRCCARPGTRCARWRPSTRRA